MRRSLGLALAAIALGSGCATMARGTRQEVSFTTVPEGAVVRDLRSGESWQTPAVVELARNHRYQLEVSKQGFRSEQVYLRSEVPFQWWLVGSFTLGVSILFDATLGGLYDLEPAAVHVVLERDRAATTD